MAIKKNHHNMQECTYLGDQRTFLSRWCAFCTESSKPWRCRTSWSDSSHYCNTIRVTASSKSCRSERKHDIESKWTDGNKSGRVKFHYNHSRIITLSLSQNNKICIRWVSSNNYRDRQATRPYRSIKKWMDVLPTKEWRTQDCGSLFLWTFHVF